MSTIQQVYDLHQGILWPGQLANPKAPFHIINGIAHVPMNGRTLRPGDGVYYDTTENQWAYPTTAAQSRMVRGIVTWDSSVVPSAADSIPSGSNSPNFIEYKDNEVAKIGIMGIFGIRAGAAIEAFAQITQDRTDFEYDPVTRVAAIANMYTNPIQAMEPGADNGIIAAAIGYGRVI